MADNWRKPKVKRNMLAPLLIVDVQPNFHPPERYLRTLKVAINLARAQDRIIIFLECGEGGTPSTESTLSNAAFGRDPDSFRGLNYRYPKVAWIKKVHSCGRDETKNWFQIFLPNCKEVVVGGLYYTNCVNWAAQGCLAAGIIPTVCLDLCLTHNHTRPSIEKEPQHDGRIIANSYRQVLIPSVELNKE